MLKELNEQDTIVYDTNALDNKTKSATSKIEKLVKKIISDKAQENYLFPISRRIYDNDYIEKNDFIFNETKNKR